MSLLDKLHDKALSAKKKYVKYPLLIASGIANWFVGTYEEIKGHGEAAKASGEERDYKLYEEGLSAAAFGEVGAYAAAMHTGNKAGAVIIGADLLVREINGTISVRRERKRIKENPDAERVINVDMTDVDLTGAIGTARTLAYKIANRRRRSDAVAEPVEDDGGEETPLIFPDPLPDPIYKDDEMRILEEKPGLEDEISGAGVEEPEDVLPFDPAPIPAIAEELPPGPFAPKSCPEPLRLPGPGKGYELPDIMEPEDKPIPEPVPVEPEGEGALSEAPQTPSSKPKVDIGPLSTLPDDEDPLGSADEEETGNKLF